MNAILKLEQLLKEKDKVTVVIDGMSAALKSTFSHFLKEKYDARVIHMDDYFLPKNLRTKERMSEVGGNVHYERFFDEVVKNLDSKLSLYHMNCQTFTFEFLKDEPFKKLTIIEGAYSMHPFFGKYYDLSICMVCDEEVQKSRIIKRNKEKAIDFLSRWIKLENEYLAHFDILNKADVVINTNNPNF